MKYRVEVIADNSGKYCSNRIVYYTIDDARAAAASLQSRWSLMKTWRVVDENGQVVWDKELGPVDQPTPDTSLKFVDEKGRTVHPPGVVIHGWDDSQGGTIRLPGF